jgi:hypothetical protein
MRGTFKFGWVIHTPVDRPAKIKRTVILFDKLPPTLLCHLKSGAVLLVDFHASLQLNEPLVYLINESRKQRKQRKTPAEAGV